MKPLRRPKFLILGHRKKVSLINSSDEWKMSYMTWAIKLIDERRKEGDLKRAKKTAINMRRRGSSFDDIAEVLELLVGTIRAWAKEAGMLV